MTTTRRKTLTFWLIPALSLAIGVAYLVAASTSGQSGVGLRMFAIMAAVALGAVLSARHSETIRGLIDREDERIRAIDLEATAYAGGALLVAVLAGFITELARGEDRPPYSLLGATGGLAYLVSLVVLRIRR